VRACCVVLLTFIIAFATYSYALSLNEVEERMVKGGYLDTLYAAYWAVEQGEAIVPILERMLYHPEKYQKVPFIPTGAYPFNVIWALAQIDSERSLKVLTGYSAWTSESFNQNLAQLAIKGFQLRRTKHRKAYGVLVRAEAQLLERPSVKARLLIWLKSGQRVRIVKSYLENPTEEGPRGGPAVFDYIEILPWGKRGYLQRFGGDFTSFI
jgi:hypothetical protein